MAAAATPAPAVPSWNPEHSVPGMPCACITTVTATPEESRAATRLSATLTRDAPCVTDLHIKDVWNQIELQDIAALSARQLVHNFHGEIPGAIVAPPADAAITAVATARVNDIERRENFFLDKMKKCLRLQDGHVTDLSEVPAVWSVVFLKTMCARMVAAHRASQSFPVYEWGPDSPGKGAEFITFKVGALLTVCLTCACSSPFGASAVRTRTQRPPKCPLGRGL